MEEIIIISDDEDDQRIEPIREEIEKIKISLDGVVKIPSKLSILVKKSENVFLIHFFHFYVQKESHRTG